MAIQMPPLLKDSTGQEIKQAIQGLTPVIPDFISDAFSVERSYNKGDITIYNNNVYEFTANKSAGAWDSTKVTQTTIGAVCTSLSNSLTQLKTVETLTESCTTNDNAIINISSVFNINKTNAIIVGVDLGDSTKGYINYNNGANHSIMVVSVITDTFTRVKNTTLSNVTVYYIPLT